MCFYLHHLLPPGSHQKALKLHDDRMHLHKIIPAATKTSELLSLCPPSSFILPSGGQRRVNLACPVGCCMFSKLAEIILKCYLIVRTRSITLTLGCPPPCCEGHRERPRRGEISLAVYVTSCFSTFVNRRNKPLCALPTS